MSRSLARFLLDHKRQIFVALAKSDDEDHREIAAQLAPKIGATLDRLQPHPPLPPNPRFGRLR